MRSILVGFCFISVFIIYALAIKGPLLFDDIANIVDNPQLALLSGQVFDNWRIAAQSGFAGPLGRPLAMLTFSVNHAIAGDFIPWQLKLFNLGLHLSCGAVLFVFVAQLQRCPAIQSQESLQWMGFPLIVTAIWLIHPLHVSTVDYVVQRMAQLSTLFMLLGLVVYCRFRLQWVQRIPRFGEVLACGLWLLLCMALSVLSKENGLLLPWLVVLVEWLLFQGVWACRSPQVLRRLAGIACLTPLVLVGVVLWLSPESILGGYQNREFTVAERVLTQSRVLWHYVSWFVFPDIRQMALMHDDIPWSTSLITPVTTPLAILAWLGLLFVSVLANRRWPLLTFAILFFLVGHSLESSIWPLEMVYEHRNYLPSIGLALVLALCLVSFSRFLPRVRLPVLAGVVLVVLGGLTATRSTLWANEQRLFRFDVTNHPTSPRNHFFYANALYSEYLNLPETADEDYRMALLVTSRNYFLRMHELDPRDLAPVVKLYQFDSSYFPGQPDGVDWLQVLHGQVRDRAIQSSDRSALTALIGFVEDSPELLKRDATRLSEVLATLTERYPSRAQFWLLRYRLIHALGEDPARADALLDKAIAVDSSGKANALAYRVRQYLEDGDPRLYETMTEWFAADKRRENLGVINGLVESLGAEK